MPIITCPKCGNRISDLAPICVYCGFAVVKNAASDAPIYEVKSGVLVKYRGTREVISIPGGISSIGRGAFDGCTTLRSITIGNSVVSIGDGAFSGCSSLESVTVGDGVESIGFRAFAGCRALKRLRLPKTLTRIAAGALRTARRLRASLFRAASRL